MMRRFSNRCVPALTLIIGILWACAFSTRAAEPLDPAATRAEFLKIIDRPKVDLAPRVETSVQPVAGGNRLPGAVEITETPFSIAVERNRRMPGIIFTNGPISDAKKHPVVVALHGTGGSKRSEAGIARMLAAQGFIAVTVDARYHGARADERGGQLSYEDAIFRAFTELAPPTSATLARRAARGGAGRGNATNAGTTSTANRAARGNGAQAASRPAPEHPFYYDSVWDTMRLVDYLVSRPDVDPTRIGIYGVSKGGIEAYMTAAVDPRIAAAAPAIGMESFHWALENNLWQPRTGTIPTAYSRAVAAAGATRGTEFTRLFYSRVVPGIDSTFDGPAMIKLIAPRPLMTINGDSDNRTPMQGLQECFDAAKLAYAAAPDHFLSRIQPNTGHEVKPESQRAAVDWFVRWLKPAP